MRKLFPGFTLLLAVLLLSGCTPTAYTKEYQQQVEADCEKLMSAYLREQAGDAVLGDVSMITGTENGRIANCATHIAAGTFRKDDTVFHIAADRETGRIYTDYHIADYLSDTLKNRPELEEIREAVGELSLFGISIKWSMTSSGVENTSGEVNSEISQMIPADMTAQDFERLLTSEKSGSNPAFLERILVGFSGDPAARIPEDAGVRLLAALPQANGITFYNLSDEDFTFAKKHHALPRGFQLAEKSITEFAAGNEGVKITRDEYGVLSDGDVSLRYLKERSKKDLKSGQAETEAYCAQMKKEGNTIRVEKPEAGTSYLYFTAPVSAKCQVQYEKDDHTLGEKSAYDVIRFPNGLYSLQKEKTEPDSGLYINIFSLVITILE